MLPRYKNYQKLYNNFKLKIPKFFNIAEATVDKFSNTKRIALKNILNDGSVNYFTFNEIFKKSNKLANALDYLGLKSKDRVGILLGQCPETLISHIACFKGGRISIPLFCLFGEQALKFRLDDSKTSVVICDEIGLQKIIKIRNDLPFLKYVICID